MKERNIYVLYDKIAESSAPLFESPNHSCAKRKIIEMFLQNSCHEEVVKDYELRFLGYFDESMSVITPVQPDTYEVVPYFDEYVAAYQLRSLLKKK